MYCVSIGLKDFDKTLKIIQEYEMAEIRLDLCEFNNKQIKQIFSSHDNLIATYRVSDQIQDKYRKSVFKNAILSGASWIDLDMESNNIEFISTIKELIQDTAIKLILSIHNYKETPDLDAMQQYIDKARNLSSDLIKLVFFSNDEKDNERVLSLYEKNEDILVFNMGDLGKETRVKALQLGAPFTFVALEGEGTAPGQMTLKEMKEYLI